MPIVDAVKTCLSKYVTFSGRASRAEFWYWFLGYIIVAIVAGIIDAYVTSGVLICIVLVGAMLPSLAVTVRRLHDVDKSGWYYFIQLIPIVGPILLLIALCKMGTAGPNQFGAA
jgi:uncharacterized membrane protein YhaH (DUF805 family)